MRDTNRDHAQWSSHHPHREKIVLATAIIEDVIYNKRE
jgi:hypothetical protein